MSQFIQILPAAALRRQIVGKLPIALTKPDSPECEELIEPAMDAVDLIWAGLSDGDQSKVKEGRRIVQRFGSMVKRQMCASYRYPDPTAKDQWEVLCASGKDYKFLAPAAQCLNCVLFDVTYRPLPFQLPAEVMFSEEATHEAQ